MAKSSFTLGSICLFMTLHIFGVLSAELIEKWISHCKGDAVSLSCGPGKVIAITSARYGGFPDVVNPCSQELSICQGERNVISEVQKLCFRKKECSFKADKNYLFDVCPSMAYIHLKISYVCAEESSFHDICTKINPRTESGILVSPNYPESAQTTNASKSCNVTFALQSKRHVINFTPLDIRVPPGYLVSKCGKVLYINLRQNKNLHLICREVTSGDVPIYGGEAAHVFTSVNDRFRGEMFTLLHFQNSAMLTYQLCRHVAITKKKGIITSPTVVGANERCALDLQQSENDDIILRFLRKDVSRFVEVTKCDHSLIIADYTMFSAKLTADCQPQQLSMIFKFKGYTTITYVASQADKVEILYTASSTDSAVINGQTRIVDEPNKDWMIILIVCFVTFGVVVLVLAVLFLRKRRRKDEEPPKALGIHHSSSDKIHSVSYSPPEWADKKKKKSTDKDGYSTTKSRDSSMVLPESNDRVWRENPTCANSDISESRF